MSASQNDERDREHEQRRTEALERHERGADRQQLEQEPPELPVVAAEVVEDADQVSSEPTKTAKKTTASVASTPAATGAAACWSARASASATAVASAL